jgi:ribosomal-protein-alanine N-acetyltransferase
MSAKLELKTERLTLKPVTETDADSLGKIITDEFVRKYLFDDEILDRNQIEELIKISRETFNDKKYGLWLIVLDQIGIFLRRGSRN